VAPLSRLPSSSIGKGSPTGRQVLTRGGDLAGQGRGLPGGRCKDHLHWQALERSFRVERRTYDTEGHLHGISHTFKDGGVDEKPQGIDRFSDRWWCRRHSAPRYYRGGLNLTYDEHEGSQS
jgi:hypothetical protein